MSNSFEDIYIYKEGLTKIGIKLRKPKQKDYGWKIKTVEVKQRFDKEEKGSLIQEWVKQVYDFEFKIRF